MNAVSFIADIIFWSCQSLIADDRNELAAMKKKGLI